MQQWKEYFVFTRRERNGILVLLTLILVLLITPHFFPQKPHLLKQARWIEIEQEFTDKEKDKAVKSLARNFNEDDTGVAAEADLFHFDPNDANENDWKRLGIKPRTMQTIKKYISKGGRFKSPEDLGKIYGLSKDDYTRLLPYVSIKNAPNAYASHEPKNDQRKNKATKQDSSFQSYQSSKSRSKSWSTSAIEINRADSLAFVDLPGIGPKLAGRILNFRSRLGGFHAVEQVAEVYGLRDSTFQLIKQYLKCDNGSLRKISINAVTVDELKKHPYIKWNLASAIIKYRDQHGPYKSIDDLLEITIMDENTVRKMKPYLTF